MTTIVLDGSLAYPPGKPGRKGKGEAREDPGCPAQRHRHSMRGWHEDGCRCPSTAATRRDHLAARQSYVPPNRPQPRARQHEFRDAAGRRRNPLGLFLPAETQPEVDDCPATRHRHGWEGYAEDGCRCPSTVKAWERRREVNRETSRRHRQREAQRRQQDPNILVFNLSRADRTDAEAVAAGFLVRQRVSIHTRALAVKLMRERNPIITARQIGWALDRAGQGSIRNGAIQPVSVRSVMRITAALDRRRIARPTAGLPADQDTTVTNTITRKATP